MKDKIQNSTILKWFKSTKTPFLMDWVIVAISILISLLILKGRDYFFTGDQGMMFWDALLKGRVFEFYQYCIENTQTGWAPTYEFPIYIIFSIWMIPIFVINKILPFSVLTNPVSLLYIKLLPLIFSFGTAYVLYRILRHLNFLESFSKWIVFLFLTAIPLQYGAFTVGQSDIIGTFFFMIGIYFYIKNEPKKYLLFFAIAIPMKMFYLFLFIPLLLLREKKIFKIIINSITVMSIFIGFKALFLCLDSGYPITMSKFSDVMLEKLFYPAYPIGYSTVPIFLLIFAIICIYAYYRNVTEEEIPLYAIYFPTIIFFSFILFIQYAYPYWTPILSPFIVLMIAFNVKNFKFNIMLDIGIWSTFLLALSTGVPPFQWMFPTNEFLFLPS